MALWPFGKKKDQPTSEQPQDNRAAAPAEESNPFDDEVSEDSAAVNDTVDAEDEDLTSDFNEDEPDPIHDAVNGETGPFDGDQVQFTDFDFSDFSAGVLNLGSLLVPLPKGSEVQVEMGPEGPKMLHILTKHGRVTPVAFAAPATAGQWKESTKDIIRGMKRDGLDVVVERGPWGRELVGTMENGGGVVRILGVDGPRWMLRMTMAAPKESADEMAHLAREITARTFVNRGSQPILAGNSLPVALPKPLAEQVQQEMARRRKAAQEQPQQPPAAPEAPQS